MGDFRRLRIWLKAHELTIRVYMLTKLLPKEETFVLISQIRRAAISVESNIAEGEDRFRQADKNKFFVDSRSSLKEVQSQLLLIADLYPKVKSESLALFEEYETLGKQITSFMNYRRNHG